MQTLRFYKLRTRVAYGPGRLHEHRDDEKHCEWCGHAGGYWSLSLIVNKISIRFFNDREIRAVWDDAAAKWWFSVLDVVGALNDEPDYAKTRNYWKYLKAKLKRENSELVSATTQLKLTAADGKRYKSDALDADGIVALAKAKSLGTGPTEFVL